MFKKLAAVSTLTGVLLTTPLVGHAAMEDQTLKYGTVDNDVYELQAKLKGLGYFDFFETTNYFGPITREAVTKFQKAHDLPATGIADEQTDKAINNALHPEKLSVEATAYTAHCEGCSGITANGTNLNENPDMKEIAVDPKVIPLGSVVYVDGYGYAVAADTGGAIKGNKIDLYMKSNDDAFQWGRKNMDITIIK